MILIIPKIIKSCWEVISIAEVAASLISISAIYIFLQRWVKAPITAPFYN